MKNAIVIPVYNSLLENSSYMKCVSTWEYYCNKFNIDLVLIGGIKSYKNVENDYAAMCFDRWTDVDFDSNEYERITFVDADTIIRWDAFDFNTWFKENDLEIVVVPDQGAPGVPMYHFNQWLGFDSEIYTYVKGYFNAGFVSLKSTYLNKIKENLLICKKYYYSEKDIDTHVEGIGKKGGLRLDAMDQTAINIVLQKHFSENITYISKEFNCQVPYLFKNTEEFKLKYNSFDFLNEGMIFHLGSTTLANTNFINDFWEIFKSYYK